MSLLQVKNLTHRYDPRKTDGISGIDLEIEQGEVLALIGPSGSGKTTTLKCLSGEIPCEGVHFAEDISLSLMNQNPILNEDETVFDLLINELVNVESIAQKENQVRTVLTQLELTNEINSLVSQLSAGQRQRLILAKALVLNPTVLLLDEPFANLDNNLRDVLLNDLWSYFKSNGTTVIWVTHNTEEALKYSDKLALLNFGSLEQIGSPQELYFKPKNHFVASFFGANNILPAKKKSDSSFEIFGHIFESQENIPFEDFLVAIRPEFFEIKEKGSLTGNISQSIFCGSHYLIKVNIQSLNLFMIAPTHYELKSSQKIQFDFNALAKTQVLN